MPDPRTGPTHRQGRTAAPGQYNGDMARSPVKSLEEFAERMKDARPPTDDDVTILLDGRRLDSRAAVEAWVAEFAAAREAKASPE
jgi:hypothetical protein